MARKVSDVPVTAPGRDHGKVFRLTEMPASQAEKWAAKAFLALARSGVAVPDDIASAGLAGIATLGIKAFGGMNFTDAEPLLDEMFRCVQRVIDPANPAFARGLVEDDIEEVATRVQLRMDLFKLHVDFTIAGGLLTSGQTTPAPVSSPT